jgi:RNA polymerase sigma-70 factor, ECF subfamily
MLRATERAGSIEDPSRVRPWFGRILRRGIADFYRSRRPEAAFESTDIEVAAAAVDASGNPCPCSQRLMGALRPAYSEVLRRIDLEGQSTGAVATALGISGANLHVRLHRARRVLRERVKQHCGVSKCGPCLDCTCDVHGRCGGV